MSLAATRGGPPFVGYKSSRFQIRAVLSLLAVASWVPSGDHVTEFTQLVWPVRVWSVLPVWVFQIRAVRSLLAVASWVPSGDHATENTEPVWPVRGPPNRGGVVRRKMAHPLRAPAPARAPARARKRRRLVGVGVVCP